MLERNRYLLMRLWVLGMAFNLLMLPIVYAIGQSRGPTRDEVYFSLARRINAQSESPVSTIVNALGEVIEVNQITVEQDGKVTVIVKETTPSKAQVINKSIRLIFAPTGEKDKWNWEQFEENRRLYPVDRLFSYAKEQLSKSRQDTDASWNRFLDAMIREGDAAMRVLETARAILRSDPPPQAAVAQARLTLVEARKSGEVDPILNAHRELQMAIEPVLVLGDSYVDLKTNDAYLRLLDELREARNRVDAARKDYLDAVSRYNDQIVRLPFSLVAQGLEFTRIEAKIRD